MSIELECPVCDAPIPLEKDDKPGDLIMCSYCKETFKLVRKKDKLILDDELD